MAVIRRRIDGPQDFHEQRDGIAYRDTRTLSARLIEALRTEASALPLIAAAGIALAVPRVGFKNIPQAFFAAQGQPDGAAIIQANVFQAVEPVMPFGSRVAIGQKAPVLGPSGLAVGADSPKARGRTVGATEHAVPFGLGGCGLRFGG